MKLKMLQTALTSTPNDINYNSRRDRPRPEMCIQLPSLEHMVNLCIAFLQFAPDVHVYLVFGVLLSLSPDTGSHATTEWGYSPIMEQGQVSIISFRAINVHRFD
ncbi:unnamed protein product [Nezara viridula]|uniref:Uncharacterized protein n=1 Tax=Nezara viridula TaxID=85310 RepID=A0A9P0MX11_NEZVI|nr:unnamed protein product [Nezara viridula]